MAETTADVRRDIELTRERMSTTLQQLENKLNVKQVVRDNPWPALAIAVGAGVLLSRSHTDVKAAAATVAATRGASTKVGTVLDEVVANLVGGLHDAFESRITSMVNDLKSAIGAPVSQSGTTAGESGGVRAPLTSDPLTTAGTSGAADRVDLGVRPIDAVTGTQPQRAD